MDLNTIIADFGAHNWLALVLIAAVYARTLFGPQSKFPVTLSPNWLPVFSALAGAVVVGDTALMGGKPLPTAILLGIVGFVSGGAADGMIVAIFGDPTKAPTWARAIIFLVDDVLGGPPPAEKKVDAVTQAANDIPPTLPPAAQRSVYRTNPRSVSTRLALSRWITRTAVVAAVLVLSVVTTTTMVETTGCKGGTPTPQTQAEIAAAEKLGVCIEDAYVADASKTPPPAALQIALDIASTCGAEAVDVVGAFTTPAVSSVAAAPSRTDVATSAQANAPALHVAAMAFHQRTGH